MAHQPVPVESADPAFVAQLSGTADLDPAAVAHIGLAAATSRSRARNECGSSLPGWNSEFLTTRGDQQ